MLNKTAKFIVNDNNERVPFISFANAIKYCKIMNIPISTILIMN